MYYVFKTHMIQWQGINLHAELQSDLPWEWHMQHDWWLSTPLKGLVPSLTFSIHSQAPRIDNYFTGNQFNLYSERLITLLDQTGVHYETFPVTITDQETCEPIEHGYQLFHLLEIDPAIDRELSIIEEVALGTRKVTEIHRLVLAEEFVKQGKALTRIKEFRDLTVIREDIKNLLEAANITGCSFVPVEKFSLGLNIFLKKLQDRIAGKN